MNARDEHGDDRFEGFCDRNELKLFKWEKSSLFNSSRLDLSAGTLRLATGAPVKQVIPTPTFIAATENTLKSFVSITGTIETLKNKLDKRWNNYSHFEELIIMMLDKKSQFLYFNQLEYISPNYKQIYSMAEMPNDYNEDKETRQKRVQIIASLTNSYEEALELYNNSPLSWLVKWAS